MSPDHFEARKSAHSGLQVPVGVDPLRITEKQLQGYVTTLASWLGWRWYHTHDSRRSPAGFPDLCMIHPGQRRTLFVELKSTKGRLTAAQKVWLHDLELAGQEALVWRPKDWVDGTIKNALTAP